MSNGEKNQNNGNHPVAQRLRAKGFVPLPRLWVRSEDIPAIHIIAKQYQEEVNAVREEVGQNTKVNTGRCPTKSILDPRKNKNAAWEAAERSQLIPQK